MKPLALPRLDQDLVLARNIVIGQSRAVRFSASAKEHVLQFQESPAHFSPRWRVCLKLGMETLALDLEHFPELEEVSPKLTDVSLSQVDADDMRQVMIEVAFEEWLNQAETALGSRLSVESVVALTEGDAPPAGESLFWQIDRNGQRPFWRGRVTLSRGFLSRIAELLQRTPAIASDKWNHLPFRARVIAGETLLPVAQMQSLERGDIILLDRSYVSEPQFCEAVFADTVRYRGRIQDRRLILDQMSTEVPLPKTDAASASTTAPAGLDHLPVHLVFEVGEQEITLEELKRIGPGFAFELDQPATRPVTIRANGLAVGTGELVQIGERIGVRVSDWDSGAPLKS